MIETEPRTIDVTVLLNTKLKATVEVPSEIQFLEDGQQLEKGRHCIRIMHPDKGDERLTWDSTSLAELQQAKKLFIDLVKKGLTPYRVGLNGQSTAKVMDEFDPHAEEVIFMPTATLVAGG
jgi:hypothetical protein